MWLHLADADDLLMVLGDQEVRPVDIERVESCGTNKAPDDRLVVRGSLPECDWHAWLRVDEGLAGLSYESRNRDRRLRNAWMPKGLRRIAAAPCSFPAS